MSHREFERKRLIAQDNLAAEKLRRKEEAEIQRKEDLKFVARNIRSIYLPERSLFTFHERIWNCRKKEAADTVAKENRRKEREEKRKRKALRVFRKQEEDKVSMKIAREERKLIRAQRKLESIRLLDELFDRIKVRTNKFIGYAQCFFDQRCITQFSLLSVQIKVEKKEIVIGEKGQTASTDKKLTNDQDSRKSSDKDDKKNDKKNKKIKKKKSKKEKKKKVCLHFVGVLLFLS